MKISYSWLKEYLPVDLPVEQIADMLTSLGLEVSGVERVESIRGGLNGVVAGKVLTCEKHPNADRLSLTTVDVGTDSPLQIVCGAPNVGADQTVWVATVGSVLYPTGKTEAFQISKVKVRGETSEGMICAADELGIGEDHSGILVLPDSIAIGTRASEYYQVTTDDIIEIELTPNRSDAICHLGVAADLAAYLMIHGGGQAVKYPEIPDNIERTGDRRIEVEVLNNEACPRYCGITLTGINIQESPDWLQNRLRSVGVKPINNIVDVTNFILHEMGQPLHAFDADKIGAQKVVVRTLADGSPFIALDSTEYTLSGNDLIICDGENKGMCIAGVYGGLGSGITDQTTNVFLESAHFNPTWIRRTSTRHDLRTDAARTFEKSTDPAICRKALVRAAQMIQNLAGGEVASDVIDIYPEKVSPAQVYVRWDAISGLTGVNFTQNEIRRIFKAMDMRMISGDDNGVTIEVPTNKADVTREADVIEEILRIYGYDRIDIPGKLEISLNATTGNTLSGLREALGDLLAGQGFLEMMGLSLVELRDYEQGPLAVDSDERILIDNTSNVHLNLMRHSLLASAIETIRFNQNRMQNDLKLFEFGRTYRRSGADIIEDEHLVLCLTGNIDNGWRRASDTVDFFVLKKYVQLLFAYLGIHGVETSEISGEEWEYGLSCHVSGEKLGAFGKLSSQVMKAFDLKQDVYFADLEMPALFQASGKGTMTISEISRFPSIQRDLALVVSKDVSYRRIREAILAVKSADLTDISLFDVYESDDTLGPDKRSLAISLTFQNTSRTLTDDEVSSAVGQIINGIQAETGAVLR